MNSPQKANTKRISIDLPEELISRFDQLRKEWGLRARGPVIEKLLIELLQEEDLIPKNQQQKLDFSGNQNNNEKPSIDENTALVLIKPEVKQKVKEIPLNNNILNNNEIKEKPNSNITLPNFVDKKVKNLRRSINSEKIKEKINDIQINTIKENELI